MGVGLELWVEVEEERAANQMDEASAALGGNERANGKHCVFLGLGLSA